MVKLHERISLNILVKTFLMRNENQKIGCNLYLKVTKAHINENIAQTALKKHFRNINFNEDE